jgi:type IV pilus assembly protein PilC
VFVLLCVAILWGIKDKNRRDQLLTKIPIVSTIKREVFVINFFYAMEIMTKEKIHLLDSFAYITNLGHNDTIQRMSMFIKAGSTLSHAMKSSGLFRDNELAIIKAGEISGDLWPAFKTGADVLKIKLEESIQKFLSLLQPVTIIFVGGILILVIYSVIMPMYAQLTL